MMTATINKKAIAKDAALQANSLTRDFLRESAQRETQKAQDLRLELNELNFMLERAIEVTLEDKHTIEDLKNRSQLLVGQILRAQTAADRFVKITQLILG